MRNFESFSPVLVEPVKPKCTTDFLDKEGPQRDIYEASKNLADYLSKEKIINVIFLDNSARQAYIGLKEIWKKEHTNETEPGIYFINPKPLQVESDYEILAEEFSKKYKNIDKTQTLLIYDVCYHTGDTIFSVKDFFAQMGFSDIRIAITSVEADLRTDITNSIDFICLDERAKLGCHPFGRPSYIRAKDSIVSKANVNPFSSEKGKMEHEKIKSAFK
jgi:hypothetical protein